MNRLSRITLATTLLLASTISLACDYPARPHIPDGSTASKEDMLAAKNGVQEFMAAVDEYLRCVETEEQAKIAAMNNPDDAELQERDAALTRTFDAANDEKALVGDQFNQQVRAYNAKRQQSE